MIDGQAIHHMDSAGAWLLIRLQQQLKQKKINVHLQRFTNQHQALISLIKKNTKIELSLHEVKPLGLLSRIGKIALEQSKEFFEYLTFIGYLTHEVWRLIRQPKRWRLQFLANIIYRTGYQALPIIALLAYMIGVVITYQLGLQLRNYGANVYIVDLLGLSILREFAPLLTAIMVAGRTGSSFTAQLGMMKFNQEIDALNTMGVTPAELLIIPRIIGLFIVLPLLTILADIFGVMGGMSMTYNMLSITSSDFLHRFSAVIPLRALLIGLGKAPVFALIIASVSCYEGMKVTGGADSIGKNTTKSVVLSIFFIIVADAIFSIIFSELKL